MADQEKLLLDLGNSRLKLAHWSPVSGLSDVIAFDHSDSDYLQALHSALDPFTQARTTAYLASVAAPRQTDQVKDLLLARQIPCQSVRVLDNTHNTTQFGIEIAYPVPQQLGVDRYLSLLGARRQGENNWLIISAGSALTLDLLDRHGKHRGGLIAPSFVHMRAALAQRFAALDQPGSASLALANNTGDAVASGCLQAVIGLIEHVQQNACAQLNAPVSMILTGGDAPQIMTMLSMPAQSSAQLSPQLVLQGMAVWSSAA